MAPNGLPKNTGRGVKMKHRGIWFVSDLHRGHPSVLDFEKDRPYSNVNQMNEEIIKTINRYVKPNDIVYDLGDTMWSTFKVEDHKRLNGRWILIKGNHDKNTNRFVSRGNYLAVMESAEIDICSQKVLLSHYPYRYGKIKHFIESIKRLFNGNKPPRHLEKRFVERDQWLLHGHTHSKKMIKGKQIHVGWDAWFRPVNISDIERLIQRHPDGFKGE